MESSGLTRLAESESYPSNWTGGIREKVMKIQHSIGGLGLAIGCALAASAGAQPAGDFYKGKTVNIVVGFTPGGGYDTYARLLSRHIGSNIPGQPNVIVQNMPGAGSLTAVRYLDSSAPKDGTVITAFNPGIITDSLVDDVKTRFNFTSVAWVGSITRDFRVCYAWHATGIKTWDDAMKRKEFVIGGVAVGTGAYINGQILKNVFGMNLRHILGYPGSAEQRIAIERGELDGECGSWSSVSEDWIKNKKAIPFVRFSPVRTPDIPEDVPFVGDLAKTQEQRDLVDLLITAGELGRPYVMSKQVPQDRLATLRQAFDATVATKPFLAEAEKLRLPVNPATGVEAENVIARIYAFPQELVEKAKAAIR